jgi:hypothetical protein
MSFLAPLAIGAGAGLVGKLFSGGDSQKASQAAMEQERQAMAQALGLLSPFQQAGVGAAGQLQGLLGEDPTATINRILGQFRPSPAFQFQQQQAQKGLESQLAGAGLAGSGEAIQRAGQLASGLAGQGQQQFLQNVLGQRQQQMGGLESLFGGGLSAAQTGAGLLGQEGQALGGLQAAGILGRGQEQTGLLGGLGGLAGLLGGGGGLGSLGGLFSKPFIDPDTGLQSAPGGFAPSLGF